MRGRVAVNDVARRILMRAFGRPQGLLGRLGGAILARNDGTWAAWVIGFLDLHPADRVLEIGFGPGVAIERLARAVPQGHVAGVDYSELMVERASARNAALIAGGRVDLRYGSADRLPLPDEAFDAVLGLNTLHVWPDRIAGLHDVLRVLKPGGRAAFGFTNFSGQGQDGVAETLTSAGFADVRLIEAKHGFCVTGVKP